jgi:hypothetical protein
VHPVHVEPPHCPYKATVQLLDEPVLDVTTELVDLDVLPLVDDLAVVIDEVEPFVVVASVVFVEDVGIAPTPVNEAPVVVPSSYAAQVAPEDFVVPPE